MAGRSLGVSEVRRRLPELVRTISEEGGRVDVTVRGQPRVSLIRTTDLVTARSRRANPARSDALRVEFAVPPGSLIEVIRELRTQVGRPRDGRVQGSTKRVRRGPRQ